MHKIVGIDPGLAATGVAVIEGKDCRIFRYSYGSIRTPKTLCLPDRLHTIFSELTGLLACEKPELMVVEDVFSLDEYPKSGIILGKVIGVVLLAGYQCGVPSAEVPVREAKKALTGNGNASKQQLEKSVRNMISASEPIRPFHASDALALAVIGLFRLNGLT
jgi:crossover junction endodeoxyribonuclease RuvC